MQNIACWGKSKYVKEANIAPQVYSEGSKPKCIRKIKSDYKPSDVGDGQCTCTLRSCAKKNTLIHSGHSDKVQDFSAEVVELLSQERQSLSDLKHPSGPGMYVVKGWYLRKESHVQFRYTQSIFSLQ